LPPKQEVGSSNPPGRTTKTFDYKRFSSFALLAFRVENALV
jgi:hypothetical protein